MAEALPHRLDAEDICGAEAAGLLVDDGPPLP